MGVYVSSHPLQRMTVDLMNVITHNTVDITEEMAGKSVCVAGMIADVRTITTKKGDSMAFVRLEDLTGAVDVTVFPQLFREKRPLWANDKIVVVYGKADVRNGRVSVVADSAQDYVEGTKVVADTSSVAYRFRTGPAEPSRPAVRERTTPGSTTSPAARSAPMPSTVSDAEDEDASYFGEESPFAAEEPEWMAEGPGSAGAGSAGRGSRGAGERGSRGAGEQGSRGAADGRGRGAARWGWCCIAAV